MHTYYGEYNEYEYSVYDLDNIKKPIYTYIIPSGTIKLPMSEIRKMCIQKTHDICKEVHGDYMGCKRIKD